MKNLHLISPSKTAYFLQDTVKSKALAELNNYFDDVYFSEFFAAPPTNGFATSIEYRVMDLHTAYRNPDVDVIMAYSGGFNCNQLLDYIDWDILKDNSKYFCGMSDITVLCNAIYAKTGQVTFLGPVFTQFATFSDNENDFSIDCFFKLLKDRKINIPYSQLCSDDRWKTWRSSEEIMFFNLKDFSGTLIGGNLSSFSLLCGTPYFPSAQKTVLVLEEDDHVRAMDTGNGPDFFFERQFTQLTQMSFFDTVQAVLIGRFKQTSYMTAEKIQQLIQNNPKLLNIPVIYGLDFGHTNPLITLPIGGQCQCFSSSKVIEISF